MSIKSYNPTTFGRRGASVDAFEGVSKKAPEKSLLVVKNRTSGRNSQGKITVRHRGGGAKQQYRLVDFNRDKYDVPAKVAAIEYDPNRGARLALLHYRDGEKRYMIAPVDLKAGDAVLSSQAKIESKSGNRMPLRHIPVGLMIHDIELTPGSGGKLVRGAGNSATWPRLSCPPASTAWFPTTARRRSARCPTRTAGWCVSARPGACATAASGRASAARS